MRCLYSTLATCTSSHYSAPEGRGLHRLPSRDMSELCETASRGLAVDVTEVRCPAHVSGDVDAAPLLSEILVELTVEPPAVVRGRLPAVDSVHRTDDPVCHCECEVGVVQMRARPPREASLFVESSSLIPSQNVRLTLNATSRMSDSRSDKAGAWSAVVMATSFSSVVGVAPASRAPGEGTCPCRIRLYAREVGMPPARASWRIEAPLVSHEGHEWKALADGFVLAASRPEVRQRILSAWCGSRLLSEQSKVAGRPASCQAAR